MAELVKRKARLDHSDAEMVAPARAARRTQTRSTTWRLALSLANHFDVHTHMQPRRRATTSEANDVRAILHQTQLPAAPRATLKISNFDPERELAGTVRRVRSCAGARLSVMSGDCLGDR